MTELFTVIALVSYAGTCLRLLCFQRGLANHRFHLSLLAWLLIVATGTSALEILLGHNHPSFGQAGVALTLFYLAHRAQGNFANIIRGIE